ncbi:MAG: hypothetical protein AAF591_15725 [Verrucomicrobiota bacterium]
MNSITRILVIALVPVLLGGCFEVTEDIVIRKDSSATVEVEITLSGSLAMLAGGMDKSMQDPFGAADKVVRDLEAQPGVSKAKYSASKGGSSKVHRLEIELEHYRALPKVGEILMKYQRERMVEASFSVQEVGPVSARVTQRLVGRAVNIKTPTHLQGIPMAPLMEGKKGEAREYVVGRLKDKYVFVTLRAPRIGDHNGELNDSGTVVKWNVPLSALVGAPGKAYDLAADIDMSEDERPLWKRVIFFWK